MTNGPVVAGMQVYGDFNYYSKGIYKVIFLLNFTVDFSITLFAKRNMLLAKKQHIKVVCLQHFLLHRILHTYSRGPVKRSLTVEN